MCDYLEPSSPTSSAPIADLHGWRPKNYSDSAWVHKSFGLEITEACVNYVLHIEAAPPNTQLYLNDVHLAVIEQCPFQRDVTDVITWEANTIAFRVPCGESGGSTFGAIRLQAVPCDSSI
ncbi:MAG: hypothetical protein U0670_09900 [Anaerolineae bacterium]